MGRGHPFLTDRILLVLSEGKDLPILGRGKDPFPTDRILVVLSVAKDLRLISPKKDFFIVSFPGL